MSTTNLNGVFTPKNAAESLKFQKLAIALGFAWGKAGAKPIATSEGQSILLKDGGVMSPGSSSSKPSNVLTIDQLQKEVDAKNSNAFVVTKAQLLSIYNVTKCREIEAEIKAILVENFAKDNDEPIIIPQVLVDRANKELDDTQRAYFEKAGIVLFHPNDKYEVTQAVGVDTPSNLRKVSVLELGVSAKLGTILMDGEGNVYFAKLK